MYVRLGRSLQEAPDGAFTTLAMEFDSLLHAHQRQGLLLTLTPAEIVRIRNEVVLGPLGNATLAHIERKSADYRSSCAMAERVVELTEDSQLVTPFEIDGQTVRVGIRGFVKQFGNQNANLFVEDVSSDARGVEAIFNLYCRASGWPYSMTKFRPRHGGGGGLCNVLRLADPAELVGLCICDRDTDPFTHPPVRPGGTASAALTVCANLNLLPKGRVGYSDSHPVFAFDLTAARTMEGLIGPHLLEQFFTANPDSRAKRADFVKVWPQFPELSSEDYLIWLSANLKDGTAPAENLKGVLDEVAPGFKIDAATLQRASDLFIPGNVIPWCWEHSTGGRYLTSNISALRRDMNSPRYAEAVQRLFGLIWTMLAADSSLRVA